MPRPGKRLVVCLIMLLGVHLLQSWTPPHHPFSPLVFTTVVGEKNPHNSKDSVRSQNFDLSRQRLILQQLQAGVVHRYDISLRKGELFHALVDQDFVRGRELDVVLHVYDPKERKILKIDSPSDEIGSEEIILVADAPGTHHVEVDGLRKAGTYRVRVQAIRMATIEDRVNARTAKIFFNIGELIQLNKISRHEAVQEYLEAAYLWRSVGNGRWQAHALERAARILSEQDDGDQEEVLNLQAQALELFRLAADFRWTAKTLVAIGLTQKKLGRLDQAESFYKRAQEMASKKGYLNEEAETLMNLGLLLDQKGDKWQALEVLERSLSLWQQRQRIDNQVRVLNYLGLVYSSLGKYRLAMGYFQKADHLLSLEPSPRLRAQILVRLSEMYLRDGDLGRALAYAQRSLNLRKSVGDIGGEATSLASISLIYREKRDLIRARDTQEQALAIFRGISNVRAEGTSQYNLGLIFLDQKDYLQALENFNKSASLARRQEYLEGQIMALYGKALAERLRGNPIAARSAVEEALRLIDSGPRATSSDDSETPFMAARQGAYELMIDLLVTSPAAYTSTEDISRSFEINERARWGLLLGALTPAQSSAGLLKHSAPALLAEYEEIKKKVETTERERKRLNREGLEFPKDLSRQQGELMETLGALEGRLRQEKNGSSGAAPVSLVEARKLLDSNTILLEYSLGKNKSLLWLVTPSTIEVFELPRREIIEQKARGLHKLLSKSQLANQKQAYLLARDLSQMLLGPVASRLGNRRILLVLDGALHYVPFSLLPEPSQPIAVKSGEHWLSPSITWHEIVYEPSASVLRAIRTRLSYRTPPTGLLAVLADPIFSKREEYSPLPYSAKEAEQILALVPKGEKTLKALRHAANRELFISGELAKYRYIHLATHGQNHPERPVLSGIVLSQLDAKNRPIQGELRLQDIKDLDLPADLVVLSACKTAIGAEFQGEGFVALPQGFMYAGAARVVVSLWNVNDQSTSELMTRFYQALLKENQTPSEALRTAQLWMLHHKNLQWRSPYYWAGFEIQGEWR